MLNPGSSQSAPISWCDHAHDDTYVSLAQRIREELHVMYLNYFVYHGGDLDFGGGGQGNWNMEGEAVFVWSECQNFFQHLERSAAMWELDFYQPGDQSDEGAYNSALLGRTKPMTTVRKCAVFSTLWRPGKREMYEQVRTCHNHHCVSTFQAPFQRQGLWPQKCAWGSFLHGLQCFVCLEGLLISSASHSQLIRLY